jgi:DNA-binding transcriptional ArsR family regulator
MDRTEGPIFKVIADPTRRKIIHLLSQSQLSVKQLTASFQISQPAISQHLRELRASKLVASEKVGLERRYRLTAGPLRKVFGWVSQYRAFFDPAGHAWLLVSTRREAPCKIAKKGRKKHGR